MNKIYWKILDKEKWIIWPNSCSMVPQWTVRLTICWWLNSEIVLGIFKIKYNILRINIKFK
jgi:hypothetical protein